MKYCAKCGNPMDDEVLFARNVEQKVCLMQRRKVPALYKMTTRNTGDLAIEM